MKSKQIKIATALLLFTSGITLSFAQLTSAENWKFHQSPQSVNTIFEDGDELWFGTEHGLVVMNKQTMQQTHFNTYNSDLPSEDVKAITKIGTTRFIGTYDLILLQMDEQGWTSLEIPIDESGLLFGEVPRLYCMKADHDGNLWIGTNYGAVKYDGQQFEIVQQNVPSGSFNTFKDVWAIEVDENNNIYFASFELYQYNEGTFTNLSDGDSDLFAYGDPRMAYSDGTLWYSNFSNNICWRDAEGWHFLDQEQIPNGILNGIEMDKEGIPHFYFQYDGIYTIENDQLIADNSPFSNETTHAADKIFFDGENNLWFTCKAVFYTENNGEVLSGILGDTPFRDNSVNFITEDKNGKIYIVNDYNRIVTFDYEEGWEVIEIPESIVFNTISSIAFDNQNAFWASTSNGLLHHNGAEWRLLSSETDTNVPFSWCYNLQIDQNDRKWLITPGSLTLYDGNTWSVYDNSSIPWENALNTMTMDDENNLWVADTKGNLFRINQDGSYLQINTDAIVYDQYTAIQTIHFDKNGLLWIITNYNDGHQVFKRVGDQWVELEDNSDENFYNGFLTEGENGLYFSLHKSIQLLGEEESIEYISNENSLFRGTNVGNVFIDTRGSLWISSYHSGLNVYHPNGFTVTSIKDHSNKEPHLKWQVYPNPATDVLVVTAENISFSDRETAVLNFLNSSGRVVQSHKVLATGNGELTWKLDLTNLPNGTYFIQIKNSPARKMVIQR